jgi:hypothetical protein
MFNTAATSIRWTVHALIIFTAMAVAPNVRGGVDFNNWNYALDSINDGSGGSAYEYLAIAYQQHDGLLTFALSTNMPVTGNTHSGVLNGTVSHGDLFLNFSDHNLATAADFNDPNVFAIRFSSNNDSLGNTPDNPNHDTGLFSDVQAVGVATSNVGYDTLQAYLNHGFARTTGAMGDLNSSVDDVVPYLGNGAMLNVMGSGSKIGDVQLLNGDDLLTSGLDFSHFGSQYVGSQVFGFSVDATALPVGDFTANLFMECINDGIGLHGATTSSNVPEPGTSMTLLTAAVAALTRRRNRSGADADGESESDAAPQPAAVADAEPDADAPARSGIEKLPPEFIPIDTSVPDDNFAGQPQATWDPYPNRTYSGPQY